MKNILNFLIEVNKLKTMPRLGWVFMQLKKPETVAEHSFRMAILSWFLAEKKGLNVKRAIKISLTHDLCEVFAGDITAILYRPELLKEKDLKRRKKIQMKWSRLSASDKKQIGKKKFNIEKKAFLKLTKFLPVNLKKNLFSYWLDYEKGISKEGRFVREINSIETLIQSIEYFGNKEKVGGTTWWESTEEIVEDPLLLKFLEVIQKKFYQKRIKLCQTNRELENILNFILEVGKLKEIPRLGWVLREVKNPETVASHIFSLTLTAWILGREEKDLNIEKLMKMALCHAISKTILGDSTPYDKILENKTRSGKKAILKKRIRLSKKEKAENFLREYKREKKVMKKITERLKGETGKEIFQLWDEFKLMASPEGYFLNQIDVVTTLLQALQYWQRDKSLPIEPLWEWAFETCDSLMQLKFLEELKKEYKPR